MENDRYSEKGGDAVNGLAAHPRVRRSSTTAKRWLRSALPGDRQPDGPSRTGHLGVRDAAHQALIDQSEWTMGILIRQPDGMPPLMGRAGALVSREFAGRYPVASVHDQMLAVAARIEDGGVRSERLARAAAELLAVTLGYPVTSIEAVALMKNGDELNPRVVTGLGCLATNHTEETRPPLHVV